VYLLLIEVGVVLVGELVELNPAMADVLSLLFSHRIQTFVLISKQTDSLSCESIFIVLSQLNGVAEKLVASEEKFDVLILDRVGQPTHFQRN